MNDSVNHPTHYNKGSIETIEFVDQVCAHYFGDEAFSVGNALRYLARAPHKNNKLEDIRKAIWYLQHTVERIVSKEQIYNAEQQANEYTGGDPSNDDSPEPQPKRKGRKKGRGR